MENIKRRITLVLVGLLALAGMVVGPAATASAHSTGSNYCGHGTYTTFGWREVYQSSYKATNRWGDTHHYHVYTHVSRFWSPSHTHVQQCGYYGASGRLAHY